MKRTASAQWRCIETTLRDIRIVYGKRVTGRRPLPPDRKTAVFRKSS